MAEKVRHPLLLPPPPLTFGETKAGRPRGDSSAAIGSTGAVCRLSTRSHLSRAAPSRGPCRRPWPLVAPRGLGTTRHSQVVPVHQTLTVPSSVPGVCRASLHAKGSTSQPQSRSSRRWRRRSLAQGTWGPEGVPLSLFNPLRCVDTGTRGDGSDLKGGKGGEVGPERPLPPAL